MGRVRQTYIKRTARNLLERYPGKFSTNYGENRRVLGELTNIGSKPLRNRVAGYIATLLKQKGD